MVDLEAHPQRWKAMPFIALAVSLIIMDATVVNVALPVIVADLSLSASDAEWINSIYSLVFAALLITLGRVGDLYGRRKLLLFGIVTFGIASVIASMSTSGTTLISARLLQGIGGAMVLPATLSTVNALFKGKERGIAFAIWGSTIGGMAAVGPVVGGWLTTVSSWHWAFLINIPIVAIVFIGAMIFVPETKDVHVQKGADIAGISLSIIGLGLIVFGLIEGIRFGWWKTLEEFSIAGLIWSWSLSPVVIAFALGFGAMALFVHTEKSRALLGKPILLDLNLLKIRSFRYGSIAALVVALGEFGMLFSLPLFLQGGLGFTALHTGVLILALAMGTFLISGGTPQLSARMGGRAVVRLGLALEAIAILGLSFSFSLTVSSLVIAAWLFLYGAGVGLATAQLTSVILADVPVSQSGQASGLQSTFRQLGSSLGVALLGALFFTTLGSTRIQGADIDGLLSAVKTTTLVAAIVIGFGLLATIALPAQKSQAQL
jgi:EmrB/QacA subfamily drug resistance transporter